VAADDPGADTFLKFVETLGELEVVIGEKARPAVAEVRAGLMRAMAARERGDFPAALSEIRTAMQRLAQLASEMDPAEGMMMREIARRFSDALNFGDKGDAKDALNVMRHKAGDPKDEPNTKW